MLDSVRGSHVVLLIGLVWVVQTEAQVCSFHHTHCHRKDQMLKCFNLQEVPDLSTGDYATDVTDLTFVNGNITNIAMTSFPPGIQSISLHLHPLTQISNDAFVLLAASLHTLSFKYAQFHAIPRALLNVSALTHLTIEHTAILNWDNATLKHIGHSVVYLVLKNVTLSGWPPWMSHFHVLRSLDLSFNSLQSIPEHAFNSFKSSLGYLFLKQTGLIEVPLAISRLTILKGLTLSENLFQNVSEMERITRAQFSQTLLDIVITASNLTEVANFSHFRYLQTMDFSFNLITYVFNGMLPRSLVSLSLANNRLSYVPRSIYSLSNLVFLYVQDNNIRRLRANTFPPNLVDLNLSLNNISSIRNDSFTNLTRLRHLNLDYNPISSIETLAFSDLQSLTYLHLNGSQLRDIPQAFMSLGPQIHFRVTTPYLVNCPCPISSNLSTWYRSLRNPGLQNIKCDIGHSVTYYFGGACIYWTFNTYVYEYE